MYSSKTFLLFFVAAAAILCECESQGTGANEVPNSHLTCFPGLSSEKFRAIINNHANEYQKQYDLKKCRVVPRRVELCIPSTKEVLRFQSNAEPIGDKLPDAKPVYNDFLCYRMRCADDNKLPDGQLVTGQFGVHMLKFNHNYNAFQVCIPAWKLNEDYQPIILEY